MVLVLGTMNKGGWNGDSASPRVFKTRWFERLARGTVVKQRIARAGQGKSNGYRTIIFFRRGHRAVFAYGFANSDRANIDADEEKQFKEAARHVLHLTATQIDDLLKNSDFVEVKYEE